MSNIHEKSDKPCLLSLRQESLFQVLIELAYWFSRMIAKGRVDHSLLLTMWRRVSIETKEKEWVKACWGFESVYFEYWLESYVAFAKCLFSFQLVAIRVWKVCARTGTN